MGESLTAVIDLDLPGERISRHIYGHFAEHLGRCIYGGFFVGEGSEIPNESGIRLDVVDALRAIRIPNLRWPGGCFADNYHWRDGIGPREDRPRMVNSHWGDVVEDNSFGTHEFMQLCEMLGAAPPVSGHTPPGPGPGLRPRAGSRSVAQIAAAQVRRRRTRHLEVGGLDRVGHRGEDVRHGQRGRGRGHGSTFTWRILRVNRYR